ncbi:MAG TPA: VWA domain-containing protein [Terriglobales bacterium]|nr:VWA domain-containing protein [Terriglobales bacterium]
MARSESTRRKNPTVFAAGILAVAMAGLGMMGARAWAQNQNSTVPAPAVRVTVRLVLADAVVTDKEGKVVTGLGPQDFTVLEDGKPQKVTTFSFERPAEMNKALQSRRVQLPPNVTTDRPEYRVPSGAPVIVLIDALNTRAQDQSRARMELLKYLDTQLKPGQPIAVYTLGSSLRRLQDFTDDPTLLKAAVQGFNPTEPVEQQISRLDQQIPRFSGALAGSGLRGTQTNPAIYLERMREFLEDQASVGVDMRVGITLTAFQAIAHAVAGLPGRKSVVWVTASFPLATYSRIIKYSADGDNSPNRVAFNELYEDRVRETDSKLSDAQVAVYPVDARGLVGELQGGAENQGVDAGGQLVGGADFAQSQQMASGALQETQATMKQVAGDTGGRVFTNQNDLDHSVALSVDDGAAYYLLGYTPTSKADGKFHKIEVKVNRPDVNVRARGGYFANPLSDDSKAMKQLDAEVAMAMQLDSPLTSGVTFDARVAPPAPAEKMKVGVDFIIDPSTVSVEDAGGGKALALEFHVAAYGNDGKLAAHRDVAIKPVLKPEQYAAIQQQGIPYHSELELGPGTYRLRIGVVDQRSGTIGTADIPLSLPGAK